MLNHTLRQVDAPVKTGRGCPYQTPARDVDRGQSNHRITVCGLQMPATVHGACYGQRIGFCFGDVVRLSLTSSADMALAPSVTMVTQTNFFPFSVVKKQVWFSMRTVMGRSFFCGVLTDGAHPAAIVLCNRLMVSAVRPL